MGHKSRWEYFRAIYGRYQKGDRKARQAILNEFCLNTGYHRKYAIRLLNGASPGRREAPEGSAKASPELRAQNAGGFDGGVGSGGIPVVGAAEGNVADVDAVDSQALRHRPREGAGITGDQPAADGSPTAGPEDASAPETLRTHQARLAAETPDCDQDR